MATNHEKPLLPPDLGSDLAHHMCVERPVRHKILHAFTISIIQVPIMLLGACYIQPGISLHPPEHADNVR